MNEYNQGHASGQSVARDVCIREPRVYSDHAESSKQWEPNVDEVAHFVEHGFLVKRGLVDAKEALRKSVDLLWENVPEGVLNRDDPKTWVDYPHEKWLEQYVDEVGRLHRGNWKMRSRGASGLGTQPFLVDQIANHPGIRTVAASLLGSPIEFARRVRGVYAIFPKPPEENWKLGPHGDYMAAHLSAMVFADDVPPHSGGFAVWPGSHARLHRCWDYVHASHMSDQNGKGFAQVREQVLRDTIPVEFSGHAGDVVFWHPRMLHSAGVNYSAEENNPVVRILIPCDYQRVGLSYYDDLQYGPGPLYQYWVDTRNFREDVAATPDNLWSNWNV